MNGSKYERDFARLLNDWGYEVIRAPSSGSATKRNLPDLAFAKPTESNVCVELKATEKDIAYFTTEEVDGLNEFAAAFHAVPRLAVRYKGDTTYYTYHVENTRETENGYAVDRGIEPWRTYE